MQKKIILIPFFLFFIAILFPTPATAIMLPLSTPELAKKSDIIVKGLVEGIEAFWAKDKSAIVSWASIRIEEIIKGSFSKKRLIVEYDGGEVDGVGFGVSDAVRMIEGEQVLLFLKSGKSKRDGSLIFNLIGQSQGKYTIDANGICKKSGFAVVGGEDIIDNNIECEKLIEIINNAK